MNLTTASSPHIRGDFRTRRLMLDVVLALLPALAVGIATEPAEERAVPMTKIFTNIVE